jgi:hypothetical protein
MHIIGSWQLCMRKHIICSLCRVSALIAYPTAACSGYDSSCCCSCAAATIRTEAGMHSLQHSSRHMEHGTQRWPGNPNTTRSETPMIGLSWALYLLTACHCLAAFTAMSANTFPHLHSEPSKEDRNVHSACCQTYSWQLTNPCFPPSFQYHFSNVPWVSHSQLALAGPG